MTFLRHLTLGQYLPGDSRVHRLDPRAKLACCLLAVSAAFWPQRGGAVAATWPLLLAGLALSRIPPGHLARGLRPFAWLFAFTVAVHGLSTPGRSVWPFPLGPVDLTFRGLGAGASVSAQLATGIAFSSLLTFTTSPTELVWALERIGSPLRRLGLPVGEFCLTVLIALSFVPLLREEAEHIEKGLLARGVELGGGLRGRIRHVTTLAVPLLRRVFGRAEALALALEARGYQPGAPRTPLQTAGLGLGETVAVGLGLATLVGVLLLPAAEHAWGALQ